MSLTQVSLFKSRQHQQELDNQQIADLLYKAIEALTRQLATIRLDCEKADRDLRGTTIKRLLQTATMQLNTVKNEIGERMLAATAPVVTANAGPGVTNQPVPLTARFFEEKSQQVCDIYNKLITHDALRQKSSGSVLAMVTDIFADFFIKIADHFRKQSHAKCEGNRTLSPAQKNLASQFSHVFEKFETAREGAFLRSEAVAAKVDICRTTLGA